MDNKGQRFYICIWPEKLLKNRRDGWCIRLVYGFVNEGMKEVDLKSFTSHNPILNKRSPCIYDLDVKFRNKKRPKKVPRNWYRNIYVYIIDKHSGQEEEVSLSNVVPIPFRIGERETVLIFNFF